MNSRIILISTIALLSFQILFSQENKFALTIEYSPNFSKITDEIVDESGKLSHNALLRLEYQTKSIVNPTIGIGILNTGEQVKIRFFGGQLGINEIKFIHNYNYVFVPIGVNINFGRFYILPEIGIGLNISNKTKEVRLLTSGEKEITVQDAQLNSGEFNDITVPFMFSYGNYFKIKNKLLVVGFKGYYGLNQLVKKVPRSNHYYGFGINLGLKL